MHYIAYLDEFGHIGPYLSRQHLKYNESPVFGFAGYIMPVTNVRNFGTWFYQRKCELLRFEIDRSGTHPAVWEKKGAALYTAQNVTRYAELRVFTNRLLNKIAALNGHVFYVGIRKTLSPEAHSPNALYLRVMSEAIKRLDQFCGLDLAGEATFVMAMDEHSQRSQIITRASIAMYGGPERRRFLVEPPFQLESHRYQTIQAADWLSGLIGRLGALWISPEEFADNQPFRTYFEHRVTAVAIRSGIRSNSGET